ncbi:MAG: hypothetical protein M1826_002827 [Phylliscum demangeonii]|nr:MAG: hypothetical protein M1826_002827 [Phylliscum demangeonii]
MDITFSGNATMFSRLAPGRSLATRALAGAKHPLALAHGFSAPEEHHVERVPAARDRARIHQIRPGQAPPTPSVRMNLVRGTIEEERIYDFRLDRTRGDRSGQDWN